jgi:hypothetical protein
MCHIIDKDILYDHCRYMHVFCGYIRLRFSHLSIAVSTQKTRCNKIPVKKNPIDIRINEILERKETTAAIIIVIRKSTIAIPNNLYEWTPSFGTPKACLYLHIFITKLI